MGGVVYFTDSEWEGEGSKGMNGIQCLMDVGGEYIKAEDRWCTSLDSRITQCAYSAL